MREKMGLNQIRVLTLLVLFTILGLFFSKTNAADLSQAVIDSTQAVLNNYYQTYKDKEHFSGASLSVYIPGHPIKSFYVGEKSNNKNSRQVSADTLFEIGSITKSFTAAILLQLEKEKILSINDPLSKWLPEYSKWGSTTIEQLLNMTNGLPSYTELPSWNAQLFQDIKHNWTDKELISYAYPKKYSPPLKSGYYYSNSAYILAGMIIEKATHNTFQRELIDRMFKPADLQNTFYPLPTRSKDVMDRLAHGYSYDQYGAPELLGKDMFSNDLSYAGAAGAIISDSKDIIKWVNALFVGNKILDKTQKDKMMALVSMRTGKPIKEVTEEESGFGLGVMKIYSKAIPVAWAYEGSTVGFRAAYMYMPCNNIVIATTLNSATNSENDHFRQLFQDVYTAIQSSYPKLGTCTK
jgi:D-alanyl-D-alanine carboxypeptidase